jgi:hypothetical protein
MSALLRVSLFLTPVVFAAGCGGDPVAPSKTEAANADAASDESAGRDKSTPDDVAVQKTRNLLAGIETTLILFETYEGEFPTGAGTDVLERLTGIVTDEFGIESGPWLDGHTDGWGNPFNYEYPTKKFRKEKPAVWSNGPNGVNEQGGGDDVANWKPAQ